MRKLILFLSIFFVSNLYSQKYELNDVTIEELKEKQHSIYPEAEAAILFQKGKTYFNFSYDGGFSIVTEVETKIKIYKKEGLEKGNFQLDLYNFGGKVETITFSKCTTFNLESGKIEKSKLKKNGEFKEELNKYYDRYKIVMPNVKEGSIIEIKYTINSPFLSKFPEWKFQYDIPVNHSEYLTKIPEYFIYNTHNKGWLFPKVTTNGFDRTFKGSYKEKVNAVGGFRTENGDYELKFKEIYSTYTLENVPAIINEGYVDNIENYSALLVHELVSTRFPNQPFKNFATSWEDLVLDIYNDDEFGGQLSNQGFFEDKIAGILKGVTDKNEIITLLFNYVKNNVGWNGYTGYYCELGVKKAFKENKGNTADINLMLVEMLRTAGIKANPVLISTKNNGIALFPSRTAFNYVICGVENGGKTILLDAVDKNSSPNLIPPYCINWSGRLVKEQGYSSEINLNPGFKSLNSVVMMTELKDEGVVSGKIREQYHDYYAYLFKDAKGSLNNDQLIEEKERKTFDAEISNYTIKKEDEKRVVVESYDFNLSNAFDKVGDKIYVNPMLFFATKQTPFKVEKREYPIDFVFPFEDKYRFSIKIPENYEIESVPESVNFVMNDNIGEFKYLINAAGNQIQLVVLSTINVRLLSQVHYPVIKDFYDKMIRKQNEKIVLKKKS